MAGFPNGFKRGETDYWLVGIDHGDEAVYAGRVDDEEASGGYGIEVLRFDQELEELGGDVYQGPEAEADEYLGRTEFATLSGLGRTYLEPDVPSVAADGGSR